MLFCNNALAKNPDVIVTIKPLHSLVAGVMGDTGYPILLVDGKVSPHDFHLKPSQVKLLQKSRIIFYIDEQFESFLNNSLELLPDHIIKFSVVKNTDINLLPIRKGGLWEEDAHGHDEHDHNHSEEKNDMHVWLNPQNAKKIIESITSELSRIYPDNMDTYKRNATDLKKRIDLIDQKVKADLSYVTDRKFIVFHDAYQYFEQQYNLDAIGSITLEPTEAISLQRIKLIRNKIKETKVKCVFREPYFNDKFVNVIVEGSDTKISILDPEATSFEPGNNLYFLLIDNMAKNIKECLL